MSDGLKITMQGSVEVVLRRIAHNTTGGDLADALRDALGAYDLLTTEVKTGRVLAFVDEENRLMTRVMLPFEVRRDRAAQEPRAIAVLDAAVAGARQDVEAKKQQGGA